jgi:hypothetical protein
MFEHETCVEALLAQFGVTIRTRSCLLPFDNKPIRFTLFARVKSAHIQNSVHERVFNLAKVVL